MKFEFVKSNRSTFPMKKMCQVLKISTSGYYAWRERPESHLQQVNSQLRKRILTIYNDHNGMVGSPMITSELRDELLFQNISQDRVARHMRVLGLRCKYAKKFVPTTDSAHTEPVAPNLLNRNFTTLAPNVAWVTDITYIRVGQKWHYLTVFIDLFSRMVVGWDLSASLERHSVINAFKKAVLRRQPSSDLLIHSDRGAQYASKDFRKLLKNKGYTQSMSRKGNCWDNAVAESFFHTIKNQLIRHRKFKTKHEAQLALFNYIEVYYNRRRRHSSNGWLSPATLESRNEQYDLVA